MATARDAMEEGLLQKQGDDDQRLLTWRVLVEEMKKLGYIAGPMAAVTLSQYLLQVISVMMVGHLGELSLSSTSIAISLSSVTGFSLIGESQPHIFGYFGRDHGGLKQFMGGWRLGLVKAAFIDQMSG
ncbi:hypothetical protein OSB04_018257 [Centaurea solstitialis]|uniref:Uncharacterized protein n=1 Tax=Centaurea solstitialis TaxID=347529 RepID=A0AA38WA99_9ASTR|nr:hypothetical protein OSB04_018257 [Centaurea solstitialis]